MLRLTPSSASPLLDNMDEFNEPIPEHYEKLDTSEFIAANPRIKVKSIEFEGLKRTQKEFLMKTLGYCGMEESGSLLELSGALSGAFNRLERLNIFKNVSVTIDQADKQEDDNEDAEDVHKVKIIFKCKEKRFNVRTGTELQRKDIAWVKKSPDLFISTK